MVTPAKIDIGLLSPATPDRPHFRSLERMLPPEISLVHEGLGLLQSSYRDLEGKTGEITSRAADFVRRNEVHGLIITGGFVTLFNPDLEAQVAEAIRIPVTGAISSVSAALRAFSVTRLMLVTPFTADMNKIIEKHLSDLGFTVFFGPSFDRNRKPGAGIDISPDELFRSVEESWRRNPATEAIYFQGATLDPLTIIQRLEDRLGVPVIASNPAMLWNILSKLGVKLPIQGYGKLLSSWPASVTRS
jgi:maleate cis-trans isomerase